MQKRPKGSYKNTKQRLVCLSFFFLLSAKIHFAFLFTVQEVTEERREMMKQALEEAETELQQKMSLIHQIRAAQAVPKSKFQTIDLTSCAGYGFLSEMSIAEVIKLIFSNITQIPKHILQLKERLSLLRINREADEEAKRDEILNAKQEKEQSLMDTLETINRHRIEQSKAAAIRYIPR
jgi:hypothetical protein